MESIQAEMKGRAEDMSANYRDRRKSTLKSVARWVYATGNIFSFNPEPAEAVGSNRGREIKSKEKAYIRYGLDDQDRVIYERTGIETCFQENFRFYESGRVIRLTYSCSGAGSRFLVRLEGGSQQFITPDGTVVEWNNSAGLRPFKTRYDWVDGKLVKAFTTRNDGPGRPTEVITEIEYSLTGEVEKVWHRVGKQKSLYFSRPPSGINLAAIEKIASEKLFQEICRVLQQLKIKERIYCIALAYDGEGNGVLPPYLGLGLESEREAWIKKLGKEARHSIWNPAEFKHYEKPNTQLKSLKLHDTIDLYNRLLESKSAPHSRPIKLLNEIAAKLGGQVWSKHFKLTDDFVVYCVDFELGHLSKNMRKTIPAGMLARLKKQGMI